ncbi:hypothetical protein Q5741_16780 [Paenibacillus sp. JX-17]|uniref:Uracil-DNA glycosylase-like domain-containing protein n=1 Tax=Paenibacillus lacisoli TaxID=3064525 RepID=A0ABT9CFL3_9BACL|nr:hypothetical protein [Paenibacillus sp. JX-17]MDO7908069.1 hypothetical protein [Paenibacillus sp. JX-17]
MLLTDRMVHYKEILMQMSAANQWTASDVLIPELLLHTEGAIEIFYAPHNDYIDRRAELVIVGITPGFRQMVIALQTAGRMLRAGSSMEEACREAKMNARFAGSMRNHLLDMLEELQLHAYLGLSRIEDLFSPQEHRLHTTSLLPDPVMVNKRNYTGHRPPIHRSPLLRQQAAESFSRQLGMLDSPLVVPLGRMVEQELHRMAEAGQIDPSQCVWGFPHPSGANGHRWKQFAEARESMEQKIRAYFK